MYYWENFYVLPHHIFIIIFIYFFLDFEANGIKC